MKKICKGCGAEFEVLNIRQIYCHGCSSLMDKKSQYNHKITCKCCGKQFEVFGRHPAYCSEACKQAWNDAYKAKRRSEAPVKRKAILYRKTDDIRVEMRYKGHVIEVLEHTTREVAKAKWYAGYDSGSYTTIIHVNGQRLISNNDVERYIGKRSNVQMSNMLHYALTEAAV